MVTATGAFCPADEVVETFEASQWRVIAPDAIAQAETDMGPTVVFLEDESQRLTDLLAMALSARAISLHVLREEVLAEALSGGIEREIALERWRESTLKQVTLFRRMRDRVMLVSRGRFEMAPDGVLGDGFPAISLPERRFDQLALALGSWMVLQLPSPGAAAAMLAAFIRDQDRTDPLVDAKEALDAWRRCAALATDPKAANETLTERGAAPTEETEGPAFAESVSTEVERLRKVEASRSEKIALLLEQLKHLQAAFESAWLEKEDRRANASRQPSVLTGLRTPVVLDAPSACAR